jgi:hypothetical protein
MGTLGRLLEHKGLTAQVTGEPPLFDVVFTGEPVRDYRGTLRVTATCCAGSMRCCANAVSSKVSQNTTSHWPIGRKTSNIQHTREAWASALQVLAGRLTGLLFLCDHPGPQRADRRGVHLDKVAGLQKALRRGAAVWQQIARIRRRPGGRPAADDVAGIKSEVAG